MFGIPSEMLTGLTFLCGLAIAGWSFAIWLTKQFDNLKNSVFNKVDQSITLLLSKLEYHERHDDQRFNTISNDLWTLRLRNAAMDGKTMEAQEIADTKRNTFNPNKEP
jgi:hypothetical protein